MVSDTILERFLLPADLEAALRTCGRILIPASAAELMEMACGPESSSRFEVCYPIDGGGLVKEAEVVRCRNGVCVNFPEDYMRRRDPDCMRIGDDLPTDKPRFEAAYGTPFPTLRVRTMDWLSRQALILLPFRAGGPHFGYESLMVCPQNAAFFALALANMTGFVGISELTGGWRSRGIIYVAPPFRHTDFGGKQVVVHQRSEALHEVFSYNLYPGPSAKKGIFSMLLDLGEREGWLTNHASAAQVEAPSGAGIVFLHEGASGGGKSELLREIPREPDGSVRLGVNTFSGEEAVLKLRNVCRIRPIADDMVLSRGDFRDGSGRLVVADAEDGWFLRVDDDTGYGANPAVERLCIHPAEPLVFFNLDGVPGATCLPWEHIRDADGKPCTNPRVILPRRMVDGILPGQVPQEVHIRSFGVRMPPASASAPSCGVMGLLHFVPLSLAWLWRLISPRGYKNPSVTETGDGGAMQAEGVGSSWPFCTGCRVPQANLLLGQMLDSPNTLNILLPNQHIATWRIGFMGEWIAREYLARRGGRISLEQLRPARCPLFGFAPEQLSLDGQPMPEELLRPELQPGLGFDGYDAGARILSDFFKEQLAQFDTPALDPLGRQILELALRDAPLEDYLSLTPMRFS